MANEISLPPQEDGDLIDLPQLARTLNRYKWSVLSLAFLAAAATALYAFSARPVYRATATLLIEAKSNRPLPSEQPVYDPGAGTNEYYASQYEIIKSRTVAERVMDHLKLEDSPEFRRDLSPSPYDPLSLLLSLLPAAPQSPEQAANKHAQDVASLQDRLTVDPVFGTQLIKVEYDSYSRELAAQVANEIADQYIESSLLARLEITKKSVDWLSSKIGDVRTDLETSEKNLQAFRDSQSLVDVGGARNLLQEQLVDNSNRLRDAQLKVTELANAYAKVQAAGDDPSKLDSVSTLLLDPFVQKASSSYIDAQESYRQQEQRYGPKHPAMEEARGRLDAARTSYYQSLRVAAQGTTAQYEIAKQNAAALASQVAINQARLKELDDKSYQASVLQRNVDSNRQLFDSFLHQFKEADTSESFNEVSARVIDPAVPPLRQHAPRKTRMTLIGFACGLLFGIVLATLRHLLSEELRSPEDLEVVARAPVFGVLPLIPRLSKKSSPVRVFVEDPRSPYVEALRSVQTALAVSDWGLRERHLMITSSLPFEGKSTLAACLAAGLGSSGRVLLLETDLRRPSLSRYLNLKPGSPGLVHYLNGAARLEECIQPAPDMPFSVLPAGKTVPNPVETISSEAFHAMVEQLDQQFDRIIFDAPPCQIGADALALTRYAGGVLFVVKPGTTNRRTVKHSIARLRLVQASVIGCVINQVDSRGQLGYYETYQYKYE
jgi:capsular exopolysaccharide synthesis family protein